MNRKVYLYLLVGLIIWISLFLSVSADTENVVNVSGSLYSTALERFSLTENTYKQLKEYYTNYINENLDSSKAYLLFYLNGQLYLTTNPVDFTASTIFKNSGSSFFHYDRCVSVYQVQPSIVDDNLTLSFPRTTSYCGIADSITTNFTGNTPLIWSNKSLRYNGGELETYYSYTFETISSELTKHYQFNKLSIDGPIYTYTNLLFGDYVEEEKVKVGYRIEYYFDDVIYNDKTEYFFGYVGDRINTFTNQETDFYKLYSENQEYILELTEIEETNVLKVYYRSPLYGTEKSPIETNVEEFYFFYNINDIKTIFPSVTFENFTQYEQLMIVIVFNAFYCLFLFFIIYIVIQSFNRAWLWIKSWVF